MIRWAIGGTVLLAAAAGLVWVGGSRSGPEIVVNAPVTPEPAPPAPVRPAPAEPAPLARVVDVADIDPLLDPPPLPAADRTPAPVLIAVGFEEPAAGAAPAADVPPIPPAAEDEPAAAAPPCNDTYDYRVRGTGLVATALDHLPYQTIYWACTSDVFTAHPRTLGELPVESVRTGWYGDNWGQIEGQVPDFWAEWVPFPAGFGADWPVRERRPQIIIGLWCGVGLFF